MDQHPCLLARLAGLAAFAAAGLVMARAGPPALGPGRWEAVVPLRPGVFSLAMGNQIMQAPSPTGLPEDSVFLMGRLADLQAPVLRLPGGDRMNRWNYLTGTNGHDAQQPVLPMRVPDWLKLCAAAHAIPLWGVNVATAEPGQTEAFAQTLARDHAAAAYFELGNELYLPQWNRMTPTGDAYIRKARPHAQVLRRNFPEARLGIPLASYFMLKAGGRRATSHFTWLKPDQLGSWMQELARQQDFYDAVVLHLYVVPTELGQGGLAARSADEVRRWAWVRSDGAQVRDLFGLVHQVFPTKQIWVTEWALNSTQYFGRSHHDPRFQIHLTMLAVLYDARFMLHTAYYVPYVPVMTYWTLYGQPAVALLRDGRTTILYDLFRQMRRAREGADGLARLDLPGAPELQGPRGFDGLASPAVEAFGFFHGTRLASLVILNAEATPVAIEIPRRPRAKFGPGRALYSPILLPDWGNPDNPTPTDWNPPYSTAAVSIQDSVATVPPNSLTVIPAR